MGTFRIKLEQGKSGNAMLVLTDCKITSKDKKDGLEPVIKVLNNLRTKKQWDLCIMCIYYIGNRELGWWRLCGVWGYIESKLHVSSKSATAVKCITCYYKICSSYIHLENLRHLPISVNAYSMMVKKQYYDSKYYISMQHSSKSVQNGCLSCFICIITLCYLGIILNSQ